MGVSSYAVFSERQVFSGQNPTEPGLRREGPPHVDGRAPPVHASTRPSAPGVVTYTGA